MDALQVKYKSQVQSFFKIYTTHVRCLRIFLYIIHFSVKLNLEVSTLQVRIYIVLRSIFKTFMYINCNKLSILISTFCSNLSSIFVFWPHQFTHQQRQNISSLLETFITSIHNFSKYKVKHGCKSIWCSFYEKKTDHIFKKGILGTLDINLNYWKQNCFIVRFELPKTAGEK